MPVNSSKYSEIINQKKQFIFDVEQTSNHVFPNEEYVYYVYIKNISGSKIENFIIKINNDEDILFNSKQKTPTHITLNDGEVKLYEFKVKCLTLGEHVVHFIGFGEGTRVVCKTLKIVCSMTYNSDNFLHRISIYDFTPYESKYSIEIEDYSDEVTQSFKTQKLPYKTGEQPFPMIKNSDENTESQSFLDQYEEARNKNEHVYQYLSRENFEEDSVESYEGENLLEILTKINDNSKYFKARFFTSGTNHLLNDFMEYEPNGFIYRMGLLTSELYHLLGIIPQFSYMTDYVFRWAPHPSGNHLFLASDGSGRFEDFDQVLLNLYPKQKAMAWDKHKWAGYGWIVYRLLTDEYMATEEHRKEREEKQAVYKEYMEFFERKSMAEEYVEKMEEKDAALNMERNIDITKYYYTIEESLYDTGMFYVNIPIKKIPANFFLLDNDTLYATINRAKPFGMRPIINYVIEDTFELDIKPYIKRSYKKDITVLLDEIDIPYVIDSYEVKREICQCGDENIKAQASIPQLKLAEKISSFKFNLDTYMEAKYDKIKFIFEENRFRDNSINLDIGMGSCAYSEKDNYQIKTLEDIIKILYNNNYNNISFYIEEKPYASLKLEKENAPILIEGDTLKINNRQRIDSLKLAINNRGKFNDGNSPLELNLKDEKNGYHKISIKRDTFLDTDSIIYSYINQNNKETIKKRIKQDINSVVIKFFSVGTKNILLFFIETEGRTYYFDHTIINEINELYSKSYQSILYAQSSDPKEIKIITPFVNNSLIKTPNIISDNSEEWTNFYRFNENKNSYAFTENRTSSYKSLNDIIINCDDITLPETSIIKDIRFKIKGKSPLSNNLYIESAFNTNYITEESKGNKIQLRPRDLETYHKKKEGNRYYKTILDSLLNGQKSYIQKIERLIEQNTVFDEDINISVNDYMIKPNDYVTISKSFWVEIFDFTDDVYSLNNVSDINLIIEGFNTGTPTKIKSQAVSGTSLSSIVEDEIPKGYFYKKISLLFPNKFKIKDLGVKFLFDYLNHDIKIFNTSIELEFKNKEALPPKYEFITEQSLNDNIINTSLLPNEYCYASDLNNGVLVKISFDDLKPGDFYNLYSCELEVVYQETDTDLMINKDKYVYKPFGSNYTKLIGNATDAYLSGKFYNDVETTIQPYSNIGPNNRGIELRDTLFQSFTAHRDNITSIQIFPNGLIGNPDEFLKIGLYTNHGNSPYKLIKEVYANGWTKNNEELRDLSSIKYNLNVNNLDVGETYWLKIQVLNPQENSYYILKSINEEKYAYKLLLRENNNYINTFSTLTFNIYSQNLMETFNKVPAIQRVFDNPYILIGLHKGQGELSNLDIKKKDKAIFCEEVMSERKLLVSGDEMDINEDIEFNCFKIIKNYKNKPSSEHTSSEIDEESNQSGGE